MPEPPRPLRDPPTAPRPESGDRAGLCWWPGLPIAALLIAIAWAEGRIRDGR